MSTRRRQYAAAQTDFVEPTADDYALFARNVYPFGGDQRVPPGLPRRTDAPRNRHHAERFLPAERAEVPRWHAPPLR
jgi:hypothetical protein